MSETTLVNAATVLAGQSCAVTPYQIVSSPNVDFRIVSDQSYSVKFYVANATFASIANAAELDGTAATHAATNGVVYAVDAGSYDFIAAVVTNTSGSPATVTVAVGYDVVAEAPSALFTVAEARLADKLQLADDATYTDAQIIAVEAAVRERLTRYCHVDFIPTQHTEVIDGSGTASLLTTWPEVTAVTAAGTRLGTTWTDLTVDELSVVIPTANGEILWDGHHWLWGRQNVRLTYTAGYATVPAAIHDAALLMAIDELCTSNVPWQANGYDAGGTSYTFERADGYNGNWERIPQVMRAIRLYDRSPIGIA